MSKDTCIKANTYCPVHKGIVGADCWHDSKDFSVPRTDWKQVDEINTLRKQVEKLENRLNKDSQEFTILCAKETEKVLREQVSKLTKERDIKEHCVVQLEAEDLRMKEQLAALAEQNEKLRVALQAMVDEAFARNCGLKIADEALSLPDLATPVLNRIRAEGGGDGG